jgi:hypothetical protein
MFLKTYHEQSQVREHGMDYSDQIHPDKFGMDYSDQILPDQFRRDYSDQILPEVFEMSELEMGAGHAMANDVNKIIGDAMTEDSDEYQTAYKDYKTADKGSMTTLFLPVHIRLSDTQASRAQSQPTPMSRLIKLEQILPG